MMYNLLLSMGNAMRGQTMAVTLHPKVIMIYSNCPSLIDCPLCLFDIPQGRMLANGANLRKTA